MDTAEVEVFLVLAEELHFGRTAQRLRLPQPRVSRLIVSLERRAGGKLFDRTSRTVRLTPLGALLRERLAPAYAQLQAALDETRRESRQTAGVLRIGYTVTTQGEALNRLADAFEASCRGCRTVLREVDLTDPYAALRQGDVDVLVNWLAVDEPDLTAGPVIERRARVLALGTSHPLAGRASVSAEELADHDLLICHPQPPAALLDAIVPPRTPSGRPTRRTAIHDGVAIAARDMPTLLARGHGIHPTVTGVVLFRRDDIALVPVDGLPPLPLGLIWCTAHENDRIRALAATAVPCQPSALASSVARIAVSPASISSPMRPPSSSGSTSTIQTNLHRPPSTGTI